MRNLLLPVLLLLTVVTHSQDLNGVWRGTLTQAAGGCFPQYNIELQVNYIPTANTMSGNAYDFYDTSLYVKFDFIGRYNATTKRMVIIENELQANHIPASCVPCVKTYDLVWTKSGNEEVLTGECKGRQYGSQNVCPGYKVLLKKTTQSAFPVDVDQRPELAAIQKNLHLKPRPTELVKTITVSAPQLRLDFYDNAEIDNDTITVMLNGQLLLYRQMLKATPLTLNLNAFPNKEYELVMYADNLGSIPPNTALLVITAGENKYEVRLASSEEKSAAVKFRYEPPPKSQ